MADDNSSTSATDGNLLECSICCGPFSDPRGLPCLHAFCCQCLENWAESCSNDNSIVICPLCKKEHKIPEDEGVKEFPAHFLVTNLQDTEEKKKQSTGYCETHDGKKYEYFCENCVCAACSDCGLLEAAHKGHAFIRLKDAATRQQKTLENLVKSVRAVQEKVMISVQQAQQEKLILERGAEARKHAIDSAKNKLCQELEDASTAWKREIDTEKGQSMKAVDQIKDKLQSDLTTLSGACEQATNVIESGVSSDIISLYPSLSNTLQDLAQLQHAQIVPSSGEGDKVDDSIYEKQLLDKLNSAIKSVKTEDISQQSSGEDYQQPSEPCLTDSISLPVPQESSEEPVEQIPDPTTSSLGSTQSLSSCSSLTAENASSASKQDNVSSGSGSGSVKVSVTSPSSSPRNIFRRFLRVTKASSPEPDTKSDQLTPTESSPQSASQCSNPQSMISKQQEPEEEASLCSNESDLQRKKWKDHGQIKTAQKFWFPRGIAIHPNGNIVLASLSAPVRVFSKEGDLKQTIEGSPAAQEVAITPDNQYIVPGKREFHIFDTEGSLVNSIPTYDVHNKAAKVRAVAVDSLGRVVAALDNKTISVYHPDGMTISKFETPTPPIRVTCTPDDQLVISFSDNTVQEVDQSGGNARVIPPPEDVQSWDPWYLHCSKQGELFIGNQGNPKAIYRYVSMSEGLKYLDCIGTMKWCPWGIAMSVDEEELYIVDTNYVSGSGVIKVYH